MKIEIDLAGKQVTLNEDIRLNIVLIQAEGTTFEDLVDNCGVAISDWNGNEIRWHGIDDFNKADRLLIVRLIEQELSKLKGKELAK